MNEIIDKITKAKHITVVAHINPDADSLGSASAMYTYILTLHKKVSFFCIDKNINSRFLFLPWMDKIRDSFPTSSDLAITFDCASQSRVGKDISCTLINIDHHKTNTAFGDLSLIDSSAISTTAVLYNFFIDNKIQINRKMATALYAGLVEDSNGLIGEGVDGTTFAMALELMANGADYKTCHKYILKYMTLAAIRIKGIMYSKMELFGEAKIAVFSLTKEDMQKSGANIQECKDALEEALFLPTVEVALLLVQNNDLSIKCSLRSNSSVDASSIASQFSGGGHLSRAGFNVNNNISVKKLETEVLKQIYKEI